MLLGRGDFSFAGPTNFPAGRNPASVAVGDFNADSHPDPAVANAYSNDVSVLLDNTATAGDDVLVGDAQDNVICGLAGSDVIRGGAGQDTLYVAI